MSYSRDPAEIGGRGTPDVDPRIHVFHPVNWDLVDPQAVVFGEQQEFRVEEEPVVTDLLDEGSRDLRPGRLESTLRVRDRGPHPPPQQQVVRTGDELSLEPAVNPGPVTQTGSDRDARM